MKEKLVIGTITMIIGLAIATIGFFIYEQSKSKISSGDKKPIEISQIAPAEKSNFSLNVAEPVDESIVDKRKIQVKGKTKSGVHTVIVSSNQEDVAGITSQSGDFSISITIDAGVNLITTRVIDENGEEEIDRRVVTYSTEEF